MNITVDVPNNKIEFFKELLDSLNFKLVNNQKQNQHYLNELEEAVHEINLINSGKKKSRNAKDFLNEL